MNNICIGDGRVNSGCGPIEGVQSGDTCPKCNGMVLSQDAIKEADMLTLSELERDLEDYMEAGSILKADAIREKIRHLRHSIRT